MVGVWGIVNLLTGFVNVFRPPLFVVTCPPPLGLVEILLVLPRFVVLLLVLVVFWEGLELLGVEGGRAVVALVAGGLGGGGTLDGFGVVGTVLDVV